MSFSSSDRLLSTAVVRGSGSRRSEPQTLMDGRSEICIPQSIWPSFAGVDARQHSDSEPDLSEPYPKLSLGLDNRGSIPLKSDEVACDTKSTPPSDVNYVYPVPVPALTPRQIGNLNDFSEETYGSKNLLFPPNARIAYLTREARASSQDKPSEKRYRNLPQELGLEPRRGEHLPLMDPLSGSVPAKPDFSFQAARSQGSFLELQRKRKVELPIIIQGFTFAACPDSGSEENILVLDLVSQLGLAVEDTPEHQKEFRIANGTVVKALGRTTITCAFPKEPEAQFQCWFYVFRTLITPLIMGMAFLDTTETLTKYKNRLQTTWIPRYGPLQVYAINNPKRRVRCLADMKSTLANADTGSELDLVSLAYVKRRNYSIRKAGLWSQVQFADGSKAYLAGKVEIQITLGSQFGSTIQRPKSGPSFNRTFYVLDGLTCDMLLGEEFLMESDAFETYREAFGVGTGENGNDLPEVNTIVWLNTLPRFLAWRGRGNTVVPEPLQVETAELPPKAVSESRMKIIKSRAKHWLDFTTKRKMAEANGSMSWTVPLVTFGERMEERDGRENHRREQARLKIQKLTDHEKQAAEQKEALAILAYEKDKELLLRARGRNNRA